MNEPSVFIDVAIPLALEGPFTYAVPDNLATRVKIGRRVLVPFGVKIRAGFIVEIHSACLRTGIKNVLDIPEEYPFLTPKLWRFICWAANYYMVPTGLMLKTALPPGSDRKSKAWAVLTQTGREKFQHESQQLNLPPSFLKSGLIERRKLESLIGTEAVNLALREGLIVMEERISRPRLSSHDRFSKQFLHDYQNFKEPLESPPQLTTHQKIAVETITKAIDNDGFNPFLLFGVTGSGKTEVYLHAINKILEKKKRALVLVPEIALTPQLARRFFKRIGPKVGVFHSGFTPAQRLEEWRRIMSGQLNVIIAARSGVFLPIEDLGLIIVDEEHDASYKQEDSCPYNARDLALARAKLENACVILGSATPSFETFVNAQRGKLFRLDLPSRHHGGGLPTVELVDLRTNRLKKDSFLTSYLTNAIQDTLARREQVVLFLNRRGFDTFAQCRSCGNVFKCPNCDITLTHHKKAKHLRCHYCGYAQAAPPLCPQCSSEKLFFGGIGTQKVEEELSTLFPEARIERLDRDSTKRREDLEGVLERFRKKEIDILTGTQMIVKGHDFPGISLVGVLCGDLSLHFPDFRAAERTFQMLAQVAGRTGRETDSGRVILQTFDPDHEAIKFAASHAYDAFFENDSLIRRELLYPPYGHLILVRIEGNNEKRVEDKAVKIGRAARLIKSNGLNVSILGPAPSPRKKMVGRFRWQLVFKGETRGPLRTLVRQLMNEGHLKGHGLKIVVDVDPVDLM